MFGLSTFWIKFIGIMAVAAGIAYGSWYVTSDHYEKKLVEQENLWQKAYIAAADASLAERDSLLLSRRNAETQHDKDQSLINFLRDDSNSVPITIDAGSFNSKGSGSTGESTDGRAGLFSQTLNSALAELQAEDRKDAARCDQLNIDTIRLNTEVGP